MTYPRPLMSCGSLLVDLAEYLTLEDVECLTLPPDAYRSPELHVLELEQIFSREWLCVGREEYIPDTGDYYRFDLLGDSLIVVRGEDGQVRALSNVCRHRYMPLVDGEGNTERFVCPYHSWTYDTKGGLAAAPFMKGSRRFEMASCSLPRYRLESWNGFLFVNLDDDAAPLAPRMLSLDVQLENLPGGHPGRDHAFEADWAGNWKLAAENSMEYYHHCGLHKNTVGVQTPASKTYLPPAPDDLSFTHERCGMKHDYREGEKEHPMNPEGRLDSFTEEELTTAYMVYVFPAFTMAMRPNTNNWLSFRPNGPEDTRVLGGYLVSPEIREEFPHLADQRRELILKVNEEDSLATTELAKAVRSSKAARGPLSPFEGTVAQFYRYLARTLVRSSAGQTRLRSA